MKWLLNYTLVALVGSVLINRIFDYFFAEAKGAAASATRAGAFVGTWTAITAALGMRDLSQGIHRFRRKSKVVRALKRR